jgi:hypothetical protein
MKRARKKSIMIQMLITSKNIGWFWYFVVPWPNYIGITLDESLALHTGENT